MAAGQQIMALTEQSSDNTLQPITEVFTEYADIHHARLKEDINTYQARIQSSPEESDFYELRLNTCWETLIRRKFHLKFIRKLRVF